MRISGSAAQKGWPRDHIPQIRCAPKIAATGGAPVEVTDFVGARTGWGGGAWGKGGAMVFSMKGHLFRVPATGGAAVEIAKPNPKRHEGIQFAPSFLPDGRHFLYICRLLDAGKSGIYLGSIDAKPEEQSSKPLVLSDSQAVFAPSPDPGIGYLLFFRGGELVAQPFDNRRLEPKGQAWLAADNVLPKNFPTAVFIPFSASADNSLLLPQPLPVPQLTWFDREGKAIETVGEPGTYGELALSPDGARLAFEKLAGAASMVGMGNLWMLNLQRDGASTRFTFGPPPDSSPVWSPDGRQVIFRSQHEGHPGLYQKPADSSKDEELVLESAQNISPQSWSQNGFLLCTVTDPKTKADLWVLPLHGERKPMPFLVTPYNENQAVFSPDGKWVAYTSWDADLPQIFVRSFAVNSAGTAVQTGGKIQISTGGGQGAHWRRDGLELYYRSQDSTIQAVEIMTTPTFRAGPPKALGVKLPRVWDCSSDGKRFLATSMGRRQYTVVLNWQTGLTKPATTN
jgi:Tol biopolymer transport system component